MSFRESLAKALNKAFDDTYPESFMEKWSPMEHYLGEDYQRHLFNTSVGGGPIGYQLDYDQNRAAGESSNEAFKGTTDQAGKSAGILAAIFGGSALGGGNAAGGGAEGGVNAGGLTLDQGSIMGGEGAGGMGGGNWYKMMSQALGGMQGGQQGGMGGATQQRSQPVDFSQPAFAPVQPQGGQQPGYYSPLAPSGMMSGLMSLGGQYGYG
jgi:hypothetical protein